MGGKEAFECPQCRTPAAPKLQYSSTPASEKILSVPDRSIFRSKMDSRMSPKWTPECLQNDSKMTPLGDPQMDPKPGPARNWTRSTVPSVIASRKGGLGPNDSELTPPQTPPPLPSGGLRNNSSSQAPNASFRNLRRVQRKLFQAGLTCARRAFAGCPLRCGDRRDNA